MQPDETVCLLNDSFPPLIDGVANAVVNYAGVLTQEGRRAMVLTPRHPEADDSRFPYPVIRYPSVDLREKVGYLAGVPFSPEAAASVEEQHVRLLHSHCPIISTILARQLRQVVDAPIILTYHTKFDVEISNMVRNRLLQAGSKRALVRNISACDEVWVVSRGAGENLRELGYEGDYVVMPNGVDLPLGKADEGQIQEVTGDYDLPAGVPVFLFVGRMQWYKGQKLILDALERLKKDRRDFRMVFVGGGADLHDIKAYAKLSDLEDKCIFTGALQSREALRCWYSRADLFLFPSTFDTNGLVVREAAACGVASVLVRDSCASEGICDGRNGFLMEEDSGSLYALLSILGLEQMHKAGDAAASEIYISWKTAVDNAQQRYGIVLDRYRSGSRQNHREPTEGLMKLNGELMEDFGHLIRIRDRIRERLEEHEWRQ